MTEEFQFLLLDVLLYYSSTMQAKKLNISKEPVWAIWKQRWKHRQWGCGLTGEKKHPRKTQRESQLRSKFLFFLYFFLPSLFLFVFLCFCSLFHQNCTRFRRLVPRAVFAVVDSLSTNFSKWVWRGGGGGGGGQFSSRRLSDSAAGLTMLPNAVETQSREGRGGLTLVVTSTLFILFLLH